MQYALGFDERQTSPSQSANTAAAMEILNLYPLLESNEHAAVSALTDYMARIASVLTDSDEVVTSNEVINTGVRAALSRGLRIEYSDYERISLLITQWILYFRSIGIKKRSYVPLSDAERRNNGDTANFSERVWHPGVYARYGIVELRVLENWIRSPDELQAQQRVVVENIASDDYMYADASRPHWFSASDINFNLRKLMTNAGFYASLLEDDTSLEIWCHLYYHALRDAKFLFACPGCYPNFFVVQDKLITEGKRVTYIDFPPPELFYSSLKAHDILFITPFASSINGLFSDGRIFSLYTDIDIPQFTLRALPSFISTYPNRPHRSWNETFNTICASIDEEYSRHPFSIFFASAGCYGLPIVDYVHKSYGCPSIYYGNFVNTLFGVRQACSEDFLAGRRNLRNWVESHLGSIPNVGRIDSGRYAI